MRMQALAASIVVASLAAKGWGSGLTELEAARIGSRQRRADAARADGRMSLADLIAFAARRRRARQTHPGKR